MHKYHETFSWLIWWFYGYYNCMTWNVRKVITPRFQCTSITNHLLSLFDCFTAYYNCMTWIVRKLNIPQFQCTSITNRFLSFFDSLTAYYSCMTWNLKKQVSLRFQCTSITNRVLSVSQNVFLVYLIVLPLITTVWIWISENSYPCGFIAQV